MKELKSIHELIDALNISHRTMQDEIQAVLKSGAEAVVSDAMDMLNADGNGARESNSRKLMALPDLDALPSSGTEASEEIIGYRLKTKSFEVGSMNAEVRDREVGTPDKPPHPFLVNALQHAIPELMQRLGETMEQNLAGEK